MCSVFRKAGQLRSVMLSRLGLISERIIEIRKACEPREEDTATEIFKNNFIGPAWLQNQSKMEAK